MRCRVLSRDRASPMLGPVALHDIRNFVAISDELATAGQPTEEQLRQLKDYGFQVVVNLGLLDPRYCLPDEAGTVATLGMVYRHIPVNFQQPTLADYEAFRAAMLASHGQKVFVHCAMNFRVSCFTAVFGEEQLGWSRQDADAHVRRLWQPDAAWRSFLDQARDQFKARA
jgi:protein tyrosine phosphatase (PTP) superfamily phosphohydrolase (DUF442 family)